MPKALNIKKISAVSVEAAEICRIMDEAQIEFVPVDNHCWAADFPYKPKFEVRMAHNGSQLLINYRVTEECVRAIAPHDDGNVWEDSCCELFLSPVADGTYYNMECNAAGTLLIGFGPSREGRERAHGLHVKGNVYKCGDMLPHPHFLSFFPINLPKPDFHRPDFFGDVVFE